MSEVVVGVFDENRAGDGEGGDGGGYGVDGVERGSCGVVEAEFGMC